jgi:transcriptional regulator GlxA family with amidase domain
MKVAYILFDGITLLDFIGIYDPLCRIKKYNHTFTWDLCSTQSSIKDSFGLEIKIEKIQPDLSTYDMIVVPGGFGTRKLQNDKNFIEWLQTAEKVKLKVSVCTGSLLLGAAGFLDGKYATTNFGEYEALKGYCMEVRNERIVEDGEVITCGAVSSSLDIGIYLCEKFLKKNEVKEIIKTMDYHPSEFNIFKK